MKNLEITVGPVRAPVRMAAAPPIDRIAAAVEKAERILSSLATTTGEPHTWPDSECEALLVTIDALPITQSERSRLRNDVLAVVCQVRRGEVGAARYQVRQVRNRLAGLVKEWCREDRTC